MEILDHTDEHSATYMHDIVEALLGKEVVIFGKYAITGILKAYNGYILHVEGIHDRNKDYYISIQSVEAIAAR